MKIFLNYNYIKILININNFDNYDLQIITTVEKHITLKYEIKLNGHVIINKQRNFKSKIITIDDIKYRLIKIPKFEGINYLQKILGKNFEYEDIRDFNVNPIDISSNITLYEKQNKICSYIENKLKKRKSNNVILISTPGMSVYAYKKQF
jgi:hypothetical protein